MQARDELVASAAYRPEPAAASAARRFVRDTLRSWPLAGRPARHETLIDDAVLLTSEMVTNAVVHAGTWVEVTCKLSALAVEVVVLDERPTQIIPDWVPATAEPSDQTSGRGLQLPSELASTWGVTYARMVKAVWFRIDLAGAAEDYAEPVRYARPDLPGLLSHRPVPAADADLPAWARRDLSRLGYEELLSGTAEAGRAMTSADIGYLLSSGEDGDLRVRAVADPCQQQFVPGAATWSSARALTGTAQSLITVPLVVDGRVTGVLAVAAAEPGQFGEHDAVRLQELADHSAPELERARHGQLEQGRQEQAGFLAEAARELSASQDPEKIAATAARFAAGALATWSAVLVPGPERELRLLSAAHTDPAQACDLEWLLQRAQPPQDPPSGKASGHSPGWRWHIDLPAEHRSGGRHHRGGVRRARQQGAGPVPPGVPDLVISPAWCVPVQAGGRWHGLLVIGGPGQRWAAREAREVAAGLARRLAQALDRSGQQVPVTPGLPAQRDPSDGPATPGQGQRVPSQPAPDQVSGSQHPPKSPSQHHPGGTTEAER